MSGEGAPELGRVEGAAGLRVAVIASTWHAQVMDGLLDGARRALADSNVTNVTELRVPGSFEIPVAARRLVNSGGFDAVVALGVVIRGGTPHFDYVCQGVTLGLTLLSQNTGIPVGFGILTCDNEHQAIERAGLHGSREDKGYEATAAVLSTAVLLNNLPTCR